MVWFITPIAAEFKKSHTDKNGNWKSERHKLCYGVLVKMPSTDIKPKTEHQTKKQAKEEEIKRIKEEKKQWEKGQ